MDMEMAESTELNLDLKEALLGFKRIRDEDAYAFEKITNCIPNKAIPFNKNVILLNTYDRFHRQNVTSLPAFSKAFDVIFPDEQEGIKIQKIDAFTDQEYEKQKNALDCLKSFWREHKSHAKSLAKIKDHGCESAVLTVHLFSQLVPQSDEKITLDRNIKGLKEFGGKCPCGCQATLQLGDTGIGDPTVWHGFPEMLVNRSAIAVAQRDAVVLDNGDDFSGGSDNVVGPSPAKQQKMEEQDHYSESAFNEQVITQCLTNGFAQLKRLPPSRKIVSSIGYISGKLVICLYDTDKDILLRRLYNIQLFHRGSLLLESVIELWVILNLHLFEPTIKDKFEETCGFLKFLEETEVFGTYLNLQYGVGTSQLVRTNDDHLCPNYRFVNFDGLKKT